MLDQVGGPITEKQGDWLRSVKKQSGHLLTLIQEILDHARLDDHQSEIAMKPIDPRGIVEDVWSAATALVGNNAVRVEMQIAPQVTEVNTDGNRLRQILMNLVSNAVKFTHQGEVVISVARIGHDQVAFEVRDDGVGILEDELPRIFDDFYQVDGSTTRSHRGTGLGLAIVKRLTKQLQGRIAVKSEVGVGSTFTVVLPVAPDTGAKFDQDVE